MGGFNVGGALSGAMGGASTGSMFGPWGTAIGAGLGAAGGGMDGQGGGGGPIQGSPTNIEPIPDNLMGNPITSQVPSSMPLLTQPKADNAQDDIGMLIRNHLIRQMIG